MNNLPADKKMTKARVGLVLDQPFFGSLALRMTMREDPTCQTAWTDGREIGYNPKFINTLSLNQCKGLLAHEVMHVAVGHNLRRQAREHRKWNVAGDYAINGILENSKIELPAGGLVNHAFDAESAESIYNKIPDPPPQNGGSGKGQKGSGSGQSQQGGQGDSDQGQGSDPGGCGEVRDMKNPDGSTLSPAQVEQQAGEQKVAVAQAAQQAKSMGNMPADLARLVEEIVEPKINWREVLRRFVDQCAKNDYRWFPPNRRHVHNGVYLPSVKSEQLPPVVIAVDTSLSIGKEELNQFASEISCILADYHTSCTVLYCDTRIGNVEEFSTEDLPLTLHPKGGGGTDFRPPFRYVEETNLTPSCLIYLTDMGGKFPTEEPAYPVLWVSSQKDETAPFGEVVEL